MEHRGQKHDRGSHPHRGSYIPHPYLPRAIYMVERGTLRPQPHHGLHLGPPETHSPLPPEDQVRQAARPRVETGQSLDYLHSSSSSYRNNVPGHNGNFPQPAQLLYVRQHHLLVGLPEDAIFGAILNSFLFRWSNSCIANPESEPEDMLKVVPHALASSEHIDTLFLDVLILPV